MLDTGNYYLQPLLLHVTQIRRYLWDARGHMRIGNYVGHGKLLFTTIITTRHPDVCLCVLPLGCSRWHIHVCMCVGVCVWVYVCVSIHIRIQ